jgi:uncharacterized protein (TIGR02118 family)
MEAVMAKLIATYGKPTDPEVFAAHYEAVHAPLARRIPGLQAFEVSEGPIMTPAGPSDAHFIAILTFADMAALQAAMASPEGQAAAADVANFATGGATLTLFATRPG